MTRLLLLILAVALCMPALADARVQHARDTLVIVDRTSDAWAGVIAETVADFNAVMPPTGPILVYQREAHVACATTTVCSGNLGPEYLGLAWWYPGQPYGHIQVTDTRPLNAKGMEAVACHEFMHILVHIGDNYGARPNDSCVWGWLSDPGQWDIARLYDYYGGKPPKANPPPKHKPCKGIKKPKNRSACQRNHRQQRST